MFSSVQFKVVFMFSGKPICAPPPSPLRSFPSVAVETVSMLVWLTMALSRPLKEDRWALPLSTPLSPPGDRWCGVLGIVQLQVLSQMPQHFRSSETQATCDGWFSCQSIFSVISFDSGRSRTAHPQDSSKADVEHWHMLIWASHSTFQ